jgi:1-deoxy-D-xylulose-5-phosphate reductoisomerase
MIGVTVLGSTGSIGISTLDVLARHRDRFRVVALTANTAVDRLFRQCCEYVPEYAVVADPDGAERLDQLLRKQSVDVKVLSGVEGLEQAAGLPQAQYVMAAIVGAAGLLPTLAAARAGKRVLLANKESLVMSGRILMDAVRDNGAQLLPIDSEHNAIFQCMPSDYARGLNAVGVKRILLTASGGPFREIPLSELGNVTPEQACAHPNWDMGRKISVDSATMMNKGLEVVEACWLFNTSPSQVQVVVHPQSVVHSMVEYVDGSVLAQLGNPDMRTPIANALSWPERIASGVDSLDIFAVARLDFERPDLVRFPCLRLAYEAMEAGGTASTVLNAANEIAVKSFLDRKLTFVDIPKVIEQTLAEIPARDAVDLQAVHDADQQARQAAGRYVMMAEGKGRW